MQSRGEKQLATTLGTEPGEARAPVKGPLETRSWEEGVAASQS